MDRDTLRFRNVDGDWQDLRVRVAREFYQRAAGMQHLCADSVRDNPILFVFPAEGRPGFHMQNVHVELDLLFIDRDGRVVEHRRLGPGEGPVSPERPVTRVLELLAGEAERLGLSEGSRLESPGDRGKGLTFP